MWNNNYAKIDEEQNIIKRVASIWNTHTHTHTTYCMEWINHAYSSSRCTAAKAKTTQMIYVLEITERYNDWSAMWQLRSVSISNKLIIDSLGASHIPGVSWMVCRSMLILFYICCCCCCCFQPNEYCKTLSKMEKIISFHSKIETWFMKKKKKKNNYNIQIFACFNRLQLSLSAKLIIGSRFCSAERKSYGKRSNANWVRLFRWMS